MDTIKRIKEILWFAAAFGFVAMIVSVVNGHGASKLVSTMGIITFCVGVFAAFLLMLIRFYAHRDGITSAGFNPIRKGKEQFDPLTKTWIGASGKAAERISLVVIVATVAALAVFSNPLKGFSLLTEPVRPPLGEDNGRKTLRIDGNRNESFVLFKHDIHKEKLGEKESCAKCHHLNKPGDYTVACYHCHSDMSASVPIFKHTLHEEKLGFNDSCRTCHNLSIPKSIENSKPCHECHSEDMGIEKPESGHFNHYAPSYVDAMHGSCIECHKKQQDSHLADCITCHSQDQMELLLTSTMQKR
ncbi:cytochrome c3 family protein [bacterium]